MTIFEEVKFILGGVWFQQVAPAYAIVSSFLEDLPCHMLHQCMAEDMWEDTCTSLSRVVS